MAPRKPARTYKQEAYDFADKMAAIPDAAIVDDMAKSWAILEPIVRELSADAWVHYDNTLWNTKNFSLMRSVRNSPTYGPVLFKTLKR